MSIIYEALQKVEKKSELASMPVMPEKEIFSSRPNTFNLPLALLALVVLLSLGSTGAKLMTAKSARTSKVAVMRPQPHKQVVTPSTDVSVAPQADFASDTVVTNVPYSLQGIIYDSQHPLAIINGKQLGIGQSIEDATVIDITQKGVELAVKGNKIYISLEE
ncbi:MAG: hypothetical protein WCI77_05055 [Candidatus Omnitrophota bacterium]